MIINGWLPFPDGTYSVKHLAASHLSPLSLAIGQTLKEEEIIIHNQILIKSTTSAVIITPSCPFYSHAPVASVLLSKLRPELKSVIKGHNTNPHSLHKGHLTGDGGRTIGRICDDSRGWDWIHSKQQLFIIKFY